MNITNYAEVLVAKMNAVNTMEEVKALVKSVIVYCGNNPDVVSLALVHAAEIDSRVDSPEVFKMFADQLPGVDSYTGLRIKQNLWFNDVEYIMGEPLVISSASQTRDRLFAEHDRAVAEMNARHEHAVADMRASHAQAVAAMRSRFN